MRRLWSISTVVALVLSLFSPFMAGAETMHPVSCHRAALSAQSAQDNHKHHCHDMDEGASAPLSGDSIVATGTQRDCPMNCCVEGTPQNGTALSAVAQLLSVIVTPHHFEFVPIAFATVGFSSHTDRGPPPSLSLA